MTRESSILKIVEQIKELLDEIEGEFKNEYRRANECEKEATSYHAGWADGCHYIMGLDIYKELQALVNLKDEAIAEVEAEEQSPQ
jgi:hypothetical protein